MSTLISDYYRKQNKILHNRPRGFGASGYRWWSDVIMMITVFNIKSWLDYGCGQSTLKKEVSRRSAVQFNGLSYSEYDPAIPGKDKMPTGKFDLVTCTDVLEHVEPEYIDRVVRHILSLASKAIYLNINIKEANKTLPDGRNTHLIIKPPEWWEEYLSERTEWKIERKQTPRPWKDLNLWIYP